MKQTEQLTFPDFIGIGAARSGSTWISANLMKHPDIWIPRRKELHYFTRSPQYLSSSYLASGGVLKRLLGLAPDGEKYRRNLARAIGSNLLHPSWEQLCWDCRYYLRTPGDAWYASLFARHADQITGEITPAYSMLSEADAAALARLMPAIRIIFVIRNPIDRAWSTIRYHEKRWGGVRASGTSESVRQYLSNPAIVSRSDYLGTLDVWRKVLPPEQFFLAFYDEIVEQPEALIDRLYRFVGADPAKVDLSQSLRNQVNESFEKSMPADVRAFLAAQYLPDLTQLRERIGGYVTRWVDDATAAAR